jgi:hypothetical protein
MGARRRAVVVLNVISKPRRGAHFTGHFPPGSVARARVISPAPGMAMMIPTLAKIIIITALTITTLTLIIINRSNDNSSSSGRIRQQRVVDLGRLGDRRHVVCANPGEPPVVDGGWCSNRGRGSDRLDVAPRDQRWRCVGVRIGARWP